jgi:hypothetical protein
MSILGQHVSKKTLGAFVLAIVGAGGLLPVWSSTSSREIVLVARDMSFYVEGDTAHANPVLEVKAGETVRVVLRNQDRGMLHDIAVPVVGAATAPVKFEDEASFTFTAPKRRGT